MQGTVVSYNEALHFGFVGNEGGSWFFPGYAVLDDGPICQGDTVEFWLDDGKKPTDPLVATEVRRLASTTTTTAPAAASSNRLFVRNLPYSLADTPTEIRAVFSEYGEVLRLVLARDRAGKFRGFCFVEMGDAQSAERARSALDGAEWMGRRIGVRQADGRFSD